ncbi:glycoside hydrolase family 2 TIM barrel-domain containing protein [Butyrivibrio sp. M55]|uniref:glycoside hydrolase family 2 TIM barrel-domain containing protein n=1 Tax=Butyrivibrio sp. M55 TaxID=1855323 RepID=UPI0008E6E733|nr:glycoside hydrolase family 2 TIM barrel-domain containing protein [Butyrivibrio sp. M55]SFU77111.1 beta-galactosidase [Butyrivibrio sp. M55]
MKRLFNEGWKFWKSEYGTGYETAVKSADEFSGVLLPHDWMIEDPHNLYSTNTGWYCNKFEVADPDKKTFFIFDGIYVDSIVYINGQEAGEWKNGYTQFVLDVSDYVKKGENDIYVGVRCRYPSSRWYSGAGIYRNVWIDELDDTYIPENGVYVHSEKEKDAFKLTIQTEVIGVDADEAEISYKLTDGEGKEVVSAGIQNIDSEEKSDAVHEKRSLTGFSEISFSINNPKLWSPENPNLYKLEVALAIEGKCIQKKEINIGFKDLKFDPAEGLFVNGEYTKLNGVCIHHDLGAFGVAFNKNAMRRRLYQFKDLGVNAIRLTHNVYAPELLDLADEMGFLVISEAFDMWEKAKTEYDYAQFWEEWHEKDAESWVKRDRNHVSVLMWSIGNEIYDTHASERGVEITKELRGLVRKFDPLKNALVTSGSNYMPWENAQKCADELEVVGYNYAERLYEKHHEKHPDWIIYGSETYSLVQSRNVYHFPLGEKILMDTDLQCSSLGNSTTGWGAESFEYAICNDRDLKYSLGQFVWTGYDYIGEPTPYQTKNSYFGLIDTAGFRKDAYYVWKSAWVSCEKDPFVHVFPYWDFNEGQRIDVRVASNCCKVELFLNGKSLGAQELSNKPGSGNHIMADYSVIYEKGTLEAVAYDETGNVIARDERKSFGDVALLKIKADAENTFGDLVFAEISAYDADGNPVENANDYVHVSVKGGKLIGLDNGDSTDYDRYQADTRRLFGGKLLAIVKADKEGTPVKVDAELSQKTDIRSIKLFSERGQKLSPDVKTTVVTAEIFPASATALDLKFRVLNRKGKETKLATVSVDGNRAEITAVSDGCFKLRCEAYNGADSAKVISELDFSAKGIGDFVADGTEKELRTYTEIIAPDADSIYGDSFLRLNDIVQGIGNNVTVGFGVLDFGDEGATCIDITGRAIKGANTIHLRFYDEESGNEEREILEFPKSSDYTTKTFSIGKRTGKWDVSFIFLPGSYFDFKSFIFRK